MKIEVSTEIEAPAARVWRVLMDFASYPQWNPFVARLDGEAREGEMLQAVMCLGGKDLPAVVTAERVVSDREFAWSGGLRPRFLMNALHGFRIDSLAAGRVRFVQDETFHGLLAPLFLWRFGRQLEDQFRLMNEALKMRAESAEAEEG